MNDGPSGQLNSFPLFIPLYYILFGLSHLKNLLFGIFFQNKHCLDYFLTYKIFYIILNIQKTNTKVS